MSYLRWRYAALFFWGVTLLGCGFGQFQTAKTVPRGEYRITMAQQFQANEDLAERKLTINNFPPDIMVRVGLSDRVDVGADLFLAGGLILDAKINLFPTQKRFALAFSAGFGAAADWGNFDDTLAVLHLPIGAIMSYRFGQVFSPYMGIGYSFYWIFGRDDLDIPPPDKPDTKYVERQGYGDGLTRFTIGAEFKINVRFGVLLEYSFWLPVVDDPGDFYTFVPNHMGGLAVVF